MSPFHLERLQFLIALCSHIRAAVQQQFCNHLIAMTHRSVKRCIGPHVLRRHIGAPSQQQPDIPLMATLYRFVEQRIAPGAHGRYICALIQEQAQVLLARLGRRRHVRWGAG